MRASTRFAKNLEKFSRDNPVEAYRLELADCSRMEFCRTWNGEVNLIDRRGEHPIYVHAQAGAVQEAECWRKNLVLEGVGVLFVFGLGLGYYFTPLKQWLKDNPERYLVFLEDDPVIVRCFLETDLAEELLDSDQVIIKQVSTLELDERSWQQLRAATFDMSRAFFQHHCQLAALQSYFIFRFDIFNALYLRWPLNLTEARRIARGFLQDSSPRFHNFYANLPYISSSAIFDNLVGELKGIPAVLSGAGPSLEKQFQKLSKLHDSALIMSSGSAVNALTRASIHPHVAGGVDSTEAQSSRLLTSFVFDVPIFYQNTFYHKAFMDWHGPLIYTPQERWGFGVAGWFEDRLGIGVKGAVATGESTSNFLAEVAGFLGNDPLVLVGMDLAYTNDSRYAKGVYVHPADEDVQKKALEGVKAAALPFKGADGRDVYTTIEWLFEAGCFIEFVNRHPQTSLVNSTEGGLLIPTVSCQSLSNVVEEVFVGSWDISGWLHGAIQNAFVDRIPVAKVLNLIDVWKKSFIRCNVLLDDLFDELLLNSKRTLLPFGPYTGKSALWQVELGEEEAYVHFLNVIDKFYESCSTLKRRSAMYFKSSSKKRKAQIAIEMERCRFLQGYVKQHLHDIEEGISDYGRVAEMLEEKVQSAEKIAFEATPTDYRIKGKLVIKEPVVGLSIETPFEPYYIPEALRTKIKQNSSPVALVSTKDGVNEGQMLCFYPDGKIKVEAFYHHGKLHGPWTYYSKNGILLCRSWYINGERQGRCEKYYYDGRVYSHCIYSDGALEGEYRSYYPDGLLKTSASYSRGKLDGALKLYYPNGRLKKEQHFSKGELHGSERFWNVAGRLTVEAMYEHSKPVGVSRRWNDDGTLQNEFGNK